MQATQVARILYLKNFDCRKSKIYISKIRNIYIEMEFKIEDTYNVFEEYFVKIKLPLKI